MLLLTDFDGTVARFSMPWSVHKWISKHRLIALFLPCAFLPIVVAAYLLRPRTRWAFQEIMARKEYGWTIVVMSSTEDNSLFFRIMSLWLKVHRIPVDVLELRPPGVETLEFKLSLLKKYEPDIVLDDEEDVVLFLADAVSNISPRYKVFPGYILDLADFDLYSELYAV